MGAEDRFATSWHFAQARSDRVCRGLATWRLQSRDAADGRRLDRRIVCILAILLEFVYWEFNPALSRFHRKEETIFNFFDSILDSGSK